MSDQNTAADVKRLYRSRRDRMVAGVCGGFAEYLNIDPVLVRIGWVIITLFGGIGLLLYIAGVIIIPDDPEYKHVAERERRSNDRSLFWGALLLVLGIGLLLRQLGFFYQINFWEIPWQFIWAVFLILLGVFLLYNHEVKGTDTGPAEEKTASDSEASGEDKAQTHAHSNEIHRSKSNRMLAGVCAGLADYFNLDPTLVRLGYVILVLASAGVAILAYIVMIIVFPEEDQAHRYNMERKS